MTQYRGILSNGAFAFGLNTPRDGSVNPLIPDITPPGGGADHWGELIRRCIPSVVLIQNYPTHASAGFGGYDLDVSGRLYTVADVTHIRFGLETYAPPDAPGKVGRRWWGTLNHEHAHNFLEFWDPYGPQGCTGY